MTEAEWLACEDPDAMLPFLDSHFVQVEGLEVDEDPAAWPVGRRLRLFAVGCCRHIERMLTDQRSRDGLDVMERYVDRLVTKEQLRDAVGAAAKVTWDYEGVSDGRFQAATAAYLALDDIQDEFTDTAEAAMNVRDAVTVAISERTRGYNKLREEANIAEERYQANLLRDIAGNPFRPVAFDPEWRTSTAVALAQQMYESRDFGAMPILADALQDAGCDSADILDHCRGPGPHVRGCWVIDLVLGKV